MGHVHEGDPVRSTPLLATSVMSAVIVAMGVIDAAPCLAQARVTSLDELRRELAAGDVITVVPDVGPPVVGQLMRLGSVDLDIRLLDARTSQERGSRDRTIPLESIQALERPRDSARNGAGLGAGIGAGFAGAMFIHALVVDRNEIDEWATPYVGAAAFCTGIGALIGWATDAARSKPHLRFDAASGGRMKVSVLPRYSRVRGIALTVSFSR
jgi:hypothetical protein